MKNSLLSSGDALIQLSYLEIEREEKKKKNENFINLKNLSIFTVYKNAIYMYTLSSPTNLTNFFN